MFLRSIIIVLDGFGVGELPDADKYGDVGTNTALHVIKQCNPYLPNLRDMGLYDIIGLNSNTHGVYGKAKEQSAGKDSLTGHFELMGLITDKAQTTFPDGFPLELLEFLKDLAGRDIIDGGIASGTEIINLFGDLHLQTKNPIIYTSADSVIQVACHIDIYDVDKLHNYCNEIRNNLPSHYIIGRVIARPFDGKSGNYNRTKDRKDFSLPPSSPTLLDILKDSGKDVITIGKLDNIFSMNGITKNIHTSSNSDGIKNIISVLQTQFNGLLFANLIDFDMVYGHRNDVIGYAKALEEFDSSLPQIFSLMNEHDLLIITSDHGCDPTTKGTDHTREYVPVLIRTVPVKYKDLGIVNMSDIAATIAKHQGVDYNLAGTTLL